MPITKKRRKLSRKRAKAVAPPPGRLRQPGDLHEQQKALIATTIKLHVLMVFVTASFVTSAICTVPAIIDGSLEAAPWQAKVVLGLLAAALMALTPAATKRPVHMQQPVQYIDFAYVARWERRRLYLFSFAIFVSALPPLYVYGTVDRFALAAARLTQDTRVTSAAGWIGMVAVGGVIGNVSTLVLYRLTGTVFRLGRRRGR